MAAAAVRPSVRLLIVAVLVGLASGRLVSGARADQQSRLQEKLTGLQDRVNQWIAAGGDPVAVMPLGKSLDELLKTGTPEAVEAQVDRILAVVTTTPPPSRRGNKLNGLQARIDEWLAAGGDPGEVLPLGSKLDELLDRGTPEEIGAQIDRILAVISTVPTPAKRPAAESGAAAKAVSIDVRPIPADAALIFWSVRYDPTRQGPTLGPSELYTMTADGGDVTEITVNNPQPYEHAAVSFGRNMIAVSRYLKGGAGPTGLWVISTEGKTETRLLPDFFSAGNGGVDWSPEGFVYFAARPAANGKEGIFRIRPDGSGLTQLVALDPSDRGFVGDVSVSEDGSMLAYVRAVPATKGVRQVLKTQIWVARADGTGQRMIDDGGSELGIYGGFPIGDFDPEISPDNKFVVFSRTNPHFVNFKESVNTAHDLWIAALDGSSLARRITEPGPISIIPDWHRGKIVYTEYDEGGNYIGLVTMAPDGSGRQRLERHLSKLWDGGRHAKWIPG